MTISDNDVCSIRETAPNLWETILWTPSGLPVHVFEGNKRAAEYKRDAIQGTVRQWGRVLAKEMRKGMEWS